MQGMRNDVAVFDYVIDTRHSITIDNDTSPLYGVFLKLVSLFTSESVQKRILHSKPEVCHEIP